MKYKYKFKGILSFILVVSFIISAGAFNITPAYASPTTNNAIDPDHNIVYPKGELEKNAAAAAMRVTADETGYYIDLAAEKIMRSEAGVDPGAKYISYDGRKWTAVLIPAAGLDISKKLNKATNIMLADDYDKKTKETGDSVWKFPSIEKRPKLSKFTLNYAEYLGKSENGQWTLAVANGDITDLQIAQTADKKTPLKDKGWGTFPEKAGKEEGIEVQDLLPSGKQAKTTYLIRVAPVVNQGRGEIIPASKLRKINVSGVARATKYKEDYKNGVIKAKIGVQYQKKDIVKIEDGKEVMIETWVDDGIKEGEYSTAALKTVEMTYGATYRFRTAPTSALSRKPASKWQEIKVDEQHTMTTAEALSNVTVNNARVSLNKDVEVLNTNGKWGSTIPANDDTLKVRFKAGVRKRPVSTEIDVELVREERYTNGVYSRVLIGVAPGEKLVGDVVLFERRDKDVVEKDKNENEGIEYKVGDDVKKLIYDSEKLILDKDVIPGGTVFAVFDIRISDTVRAELEDSEKYLETKDFTVSGIHANSMFKSDALEVIFVDEIVDEYTDVFTGEQTDTKKIAVVRLKRIGGSDNYSPFRTINPHFPTANAANTVAVKISEAGSKYSVYSPTVTRNLTTSDAMKSVTGTPSAETSEIRVTAEKGDYAYMSKFKFELGENPVWKLDELEFTTAAGNSVPSNSLDINKDEDKEKFISVDIDAGVSEDFTVGTGHGVYVRVKEMETKYSIDAIPERKWTKIYTVTANDYTDGGADITTDVTVSGTINVPLADEHEITVELTNNTFKTAITKDTDVTSWINLPKGLTAIVTNPVAQDSEEITITIKGTPTEPSEANISVRIPADRLTSGSTPITTTSNDNAKFEIKAPSAVVNPIDVKGIIGQKITEADGYIIRIGLSNDTFKTDDGKLLEGWIKNLPAGLTAGEMTITGNNTANPTAAIPITGTPTAVSNEDISIIIPKEVLTN
ncbi:MAG: hypothetical protein FWH10_07685, partial [Oscillospiraceae bacterium]|nr:hypothetical protein [Oscillospiraceae bacterium]